MSSVQKYFGLGFIYIPECLGDLKMDGCQVVIFIHS